MAGLYGTEIRLSRLLRMSAVYRFSSRHLSEIHVAVLFSSERLGIIVPWLKDSFAAAALIGFMIASFYLASALAS